MCSGISLTSASVCNGEPSALCGEAVPLDLVGLQPATDVAFDQEPPAVVVEDPTVGQPAPLLFRELFAFILPGQRLLHNRKVAGGGSFPVAQ